MVSGASSITTVTDQRTYVAPPGCVFPVADAAAAPAVAATTVMYDSGTGTLVNGTGTAGSVTPTGFIQVAGSSLVNTSAGGKGLTPGIPSTDPWGIGYGTVNNGEDGGGTVTTQMQVAFTADGTSDYEVYYKWQLAIPAQAYSGGGDTLTGCAVFLQVLMDGTQVDAVLLAVGDDPKSTSGGGSASWYTSAALGTTLSAGRHTATLALQTFGTFDGSSSGVFCGDVHGSGSTIFGAGSTYLNALTAENCILRVMAVPAGLSCFSGILFDVKCPGSVSPPPGLPTPTGDGAT